MRRQHRTLAYIRLSLLLGLLPLVGCSGVRPVMPTLAVLHSTPGPEPKIISVGVTATPLATSRPTGTAASESTLFSSPRRTTEAAATATPSAIPATATAAVPPTSSADVEPQQPEPKWLLAFDSDRSGNDEIYLLPADGGDAVNVTRHPAEDRYPAWSPDGGRIAFQSNRDGNWEIYTLGLRDGRLHRLTTHLAYDGAPAWSSDGAWIFFESYRDTSPCQTGTPVPNPGSCPDLEIYRVPVVGGPPQRLTHSPGGDIEPSPSPDSAWVAFTSWRDGNKEIYVMPFGGGAARNITNHEADDWSPAWSPDDRTLSFVSRRAGVTELYRQPVVGGPAWPLTSNAVPEERPTRWEDGSLLFARYDPGPPFEVHNPTYPGEYHAYFVPPNATAAHPLASSIPIRHPAAAPVARAGSQAAANAKHRTRAQLQPASPPKQLELKRLDEIVGPDPRLVAGADTAFRRWRAAVQQHSGHDFLGRVSDVFRPAAYYSHRLGYLSWHKAGRAVDLLFDWRDSQGNNALYIVREDISGQVFWRLYLKCAIQDGSMGEPLTEAPWQFWWHTAPPGNPEAVPEGGRRLPIPSGYFSDVTALAERFGWARIPSYHLNDFHWQRDSTATEYWHYQYTAGLTWHEAMSQIYDQALLEELFSRPVAAAHGQSEQVMDGKDLPTLDPP